VPAPATDPNRRDPRTVADLASYLPASPVWVWVYRRSSWRPGVILQASALAATVRYRTNQGVGTSVDTVTGRLPRASGGIRYVPRPARPAERLMTRDQPTRQ
jgi:hypothetical protein